MKSDVIVSAANPLVKRIRQMSSRRYRRREGVFLVEGAQPVWRAVEAGWEVETLVVAPDLLSRTAAGLVAEQEARGTRVARLSAELFTRLSERDGPAGVAAIVRSRSTRLDDLAVEPGAVFAVLHRVGNPGNLGTVVRTVDAVGGAGVVLVGETADPYAPAAVKASMGSLFAVDVAHARDADAFLDWAKRHGVQVVATSGYADADHWSAEYRPPLAVLLGSEGDGLPDDLLDRADLRVRIPMTGTAESLNLAVAAGVVLYEVRRHAPDFRR
ncbi:TrmH family RNA methyltransferase [Thermobifida cellulosilytica]|nr:RNA methyltransferase [Thermobifida cellulosilytica]